MMTMVIITSLLRLREWTEVHSVMVYIYSLDVYALRKLYASKHIQPLANTVNPATDTARASIDTYWSLTNTFMTETGTARA